VGLAPGGPIVCETAAGWEGSNFQPSHLQRLIEEPGVYPAVNQVALHPRLQQAGLRRLHAELEIVTEAWSPLAHIAELEMPADHNPDPA
jgi:diketogulonate reductase-like aldo/keto reductase